MNPLMSMIGNMGGGNNPMGAMMQAMQMVNKLKQAGNPQASNADIAKHLQEQDRKYLDRIIENQNKIISMLEDSKSTKQ